MKKLIILMITAFVDMAGLFMVIPILPFYAEMIVRERARSNTRFSSQRSPLRSFCTAPLWGRVSDRYGRRPALLIGLAGSAAAYVIFAYANSLWLLYLSRLVQGAGGGTTGVVQAYVADAVAPEHRAKGLGWISAATNAGLIIGPGLGSLALTHGNAWPRSRARRSALPSSTCSLRGAS